MENEKPNAIIIRYKSYSVRSRKEMLTWSKAKLFLGRGTIGSIRGSSRTQRDRAQENGTGWNPPLSSTGWAPLDKRWQRSHENRITGTSWKVLTLSFRTGVGRNQTHGRKRERDGEWSRRARLSIPLLPAAVMLRPMRRAGDSCSFSIDRSCAAKAYTWSCRKRWVGNRNLCSPPPSHPVSDAPVVNPDLSMCVCAARTPLFFLRAAVFLALQQTTGVRTRGVAPSSSRSPNWRHPPGHHHAGLHYYSLGRSCPWRDVAVWSLAA
jgi:hypothetical protein